MDTTIDQQVAKGEALVPHAKRLRIRRRNFCLLSDIKYKESTLQLMYDVLRLTPFFKAFLEDFVYQVEHKDTKKSNEMYYPRFTKVIIHHFMSKDPSIPRRHKFGTLLPIELTNKDIRNSNASKEYYAVAIGSIPPKPKASVRKTRSSSDTTVTPLTAAAGPILTTFEKGKQADKASKAKRTGTLLGVPDVPTDKSEEEISWNSTNEEGDNDEGKDNDGDNDGDDGEEGDDDDDDDDEQDDDEAQDDDDEGNDKDDEEEGSDDEQASDEEEFIHPSLSTHAKEETMDEESFEPISKIAENSDDEGNGEGNIGWEEGHDEEEEQDQLYRDSDQLRDEAQAKNDEFLKTINENMQKIIKELVKEQVKTSYAIATYLSEMELRKILIEKIEGNKSIHQSNKQRNLYNALVEANESNKIILDTYGDITLKRHRDDDADKDEGPSAGSDRGSKRRREGKEPKSASVPKKKATKSDGKSTQGSKSQQTSASESARAEEPMQTTFEMEEPSHPEFDTCTDDQPIVESSQHPEWFSQQKKPPTPNRDWNKILPATHKSIQSWISELTKQSDSRFSFNELMDTPVDFSNFLINRLKVDTLTPELLAGPTYELMKGSCKSLVELEYQLEEVYKVIKDQLDWVNPEGQQYPHNLLNPLPMIPHSQGHRVIPFDHFINNDLEYLCGGASSRKYTTSVTKTKAADYGHIKWIEELMPNTMWIQEPIGYDKHTLWESPRKLTNLTVKERFAFNVSLQMFTRSIVIQRRVEDLQLSVESYQKKLNLTKPDTYRYDLKCKEAFIAYSNPSAFIYQNKDKQNRLMQIDELHKFNDGMLIDVRTALDDRLKGIRMKYLPQSI
nr:hypothetical protein [Tanacetum cinerariifolium]